MNDIMVLVINGLIYKAEVVNRPPSDTSTGAKESIYFASTSKGGYDAGNNNFPNGVEAGAYLTKPYVGLMTAMNVKGNNYKTVGFTWFSHPGGTNSSEGNSVSAYKTAGNETALHHGSSGSVGYVVVPYGTHPRSIKLERLHTVKNPLLAPYMDDLTRPSTNAVKGAAQAQKAARVEVTDLGLF